MSPADRETLSVDALSAGAMTPFHEPLLRSAVTHLRPALRQRAILLDLGCGYGAVTAAMKMAAPRLVGLDLDPEAVAYARLRCPDVPYVVGDAHDIPFANNSVDALLSVSTLQYTRWRPVLTECHRVLKPGGRGVFIENLRGNPLVACYRLLRRLAWLAPSFPGLGPMSRDPVPLRHINWNERQAFAEVFGEAESTAHYLTTPLAVVGARMFRSLAGFDRTLLGARPELAQRAWIMTVNVTKAPAAGT